MVTRQQSWQERCREQGRCIKCGKQAVPKARGIFSQYCLKHLLAQREYNRKRNGFKRRNVGSLSYRMVTETKRES